MYTRFQVWIHTNKYLDTPSGSLDTCENACIHAFGFGYTHQCCVDTNKNGSSDTRTNVCIHAFIGGYTQGLIRYTPDYLCVYTHKCVYTQTFMCVSTQYPCVYPNIECVDPRKKRCVYPRISTSLFLFSTCL